MKNEITITVPSIFYLLEMSENIRQQYLTRKQFCINFLTSKGIKHSESQYGVAIDCSGFSAKQWNDIKSMKDLAPKIDLSELKKCQSI